MNEAALTIPFSNPSAAAGGDCLKIEQEPWGKDVGKTTNMQAILAVSAAVYGARWPKAYCGGLDGRFKATVYVYPCDPHMSYQFKVSHGLVSGRSIGVPIREEVVQCGLQLEHTLDYPALIIVSKAWPGSCYDNRGTVTSRPTVTVDGNKVTLNKQVYGSLRIRYLVIRHIYDVTVSKRLDALENTYQSVAFCVFNGGVEWIDIEAPAGFEDTDGECGNGGIYDEDGNLIRLSGVDICSPDYHKLPVAVTADRRIKVDFCSQETISDKTNETVDYDSQREECDG